MKGCLSAFVSIFAEKKMRYFIMALIVLSLGCVACADPLYAPSWWGLDDDWTRSSCQDFEDDALPRPYSYHVGIGGETYDNWWIEGDLQWFDTMSAGGTDWQGFWGIDNTQGTSAITAQMHIVPFNIEDSSRYKEVFFEFEWYAQGPGFSLNVSLEAPDGYDVYIVGSGGEMLSDYERLTYGYREIWPQPASEEFIITFTAQPGAVVALNTFCFGTHCEVIPEPSTIAMIITGAGGLMLTGLRRLRKNGK